MRDKYESYADTATIKPLRFLREAQDGKNHAFDDYVFNQRKNKVYTTSGKNSQPLKHDSVSIAPCTMDVMTSIFYERCMDFSKYKPQDTIPISFVLDGTVYSSSIRYLGKEIIDNDILGKVRCIKFRPKVIQGTVFKEGDKMTVWVTDDENKMPVYVEAEIFVGKIKVYLINYSGLRNKTNCIVEKKK